MKQPDTVAESAKLATVGDVVGYIDVLIAAQHGSDNKAGMAILAA
jgi:hypothetical protein